MPRKAPNSQDLHALGAGADRRIVTVLFADLSGFTRMAETMDPEEVASILNACFEILTAPILHYGGMLDKYIGDAVMALFGAPVTHEDDAQRALHAAWEMQVHLQDFLDQLHVDRGVGLSLRIGVNTGLVVAGAMGGSMRQDYTVLGDTVNLAQRMEAAAEPGTILVAPQTYRLTAERFHFEIQPPLLVKGRHQPLQPYRLLGVRETPAMSEGEWLHARSRELLALHGRWDAVLAGHPQVVYLVGEAGVGKSCLSMALRAQLGTALWAGARCLSFGQERPSLATILTELASGLGQDLPSLLSCYLSELDRQRLGGYVAIAPASTGEPAGPSAVYMALVKLLVAVSQQCPVVISLEDLQWADEATMAWWSFLQQSPALACPAGVRLMLLGQCRPGVPLPACERMDVMALALAPFGPQEARSYLARHLGLAADPGTWPPLMVAEIERLASQGEGNPLFLRELARMHQEQGSEGMLPMTISGMIAARLDALEASERGVLQLASVLGRDFYRCQLEALGAVSGLPDLHVESLGTLLDRLVARGYLHEVDEQRLAFVQVLIQEVAYQGLLRSTRCEWHARTAEILAEQGSAPAHLAYHLLRSGREGDRERAAVQLLEAGALAQRQFANQEARSCYDHALALTLPADLRLAILEARGSLLALIGEAAAALADLQEACTLCGDACWIGARLHGLMAGVHERKGDFQAAQASYARGRLLLEGMPRPLVADTAQTLQAEGLRLALGEAWLQVRQGAFLGAQQACQELIESRGTPPAQRALACSILGIALDRLCRWEEALDAHQNALELREEAQDLPGMASSLNNLGMVRLELGHWGEASRCYEQSLMLHERIGDCGRAAALLNNLGDLRVRQGELATGIALHQEALAIRRGLQDAFGIGASLCALGYAFLQDGDASGATRLLQEGSLLLAGIGGQELLVEAYQAWGQALHAAGQTLEAIVRLDQALALATEQGSSLRIAISRRELAAVALDQDKLDEAGTWLEGARPLFELLRGGPEVARWKLVLARYLRATGQVDQAWVMLEETLRLLAMLGACKDLDRTRDLASSWRRSSGKNLLPTEQVDGEPLR